MVTVEQQRSGADARAWQVRAERWRVEAEQWRGEVERLRERLRVQEEEVGALRKRVGELVGQVEALAEKLATYARMLFGDSSEKSRPNASKRGRPRGGPESGSAGGGGGGEKRGRGQQRGAAGHGRRDYSGLDTEEEVVDLPAEARVCPHCGSWYVPFGEECCEQIDWRVRIVRVVIRRLRYLRGCACPVKGIITAPAPGKAIAKGRLTNGFLARLLVCKFGLGLPTHRIVAMLAADGLAMAEGSLAGVFAALSKLLEPLAAAIVAHNAAAAHLHVDETRWSVFQAVEGKDSHRWWLWVFAAADSVVFRIAPSRSLAVLAEHLGLSADEAGKLTLPAGRQVLLSSDFYVVYQILAGVDGIVTLWCWAHIRRRFIKARDAHPQLRAWAEDWLERIAALYTAHHAMTAAAARDSDAHRLALAQYHAALNGIDTERQSQSELVGQHPAAAKVLATLNREWDGLARHREHPDLPLDNNSAERALRTPVVGRKNFYGAGSVVSAELASRTWTVLATIDRAGYNPLAYLRSYLAACAANHGQPPTGADLARFLPWSANPTDRETWTRPAAGTPTTPNPTTTTPTAGPAP